MRTEYKPLKFTVTDKRTVTLCDCQRTKNAPFCDGSHG
ncbi:MAG: CDGSH iron-sulfur domain-containing protein [Candidatus Brocadia sp.]|nr:CDGSH iron-sulfur domain-containing protein [Candidatus Brocadia sp.]